MARPLADYLEIRSAAPVSMSDDGTRILVSSNLSGTAQLYRTDPDGAPLVQLTDFPEPVGAGSYVPERGDILLTLDDGGNERHQLYLLADEAGAEVTPLVHDPDHIHRPGGITRDGTLLAYASNRRNGTDFDVYVRSLVDGSERCVFDMGGWCQPSGFSPDNRWLAVVRLTERNGDNDLYLVDLESGEVVHVSPHDDEAAFSGPSWLPDSSACYFTTDTGRDRRAVARWDVAEQRWQYVLERDWDCSVSVSWTGTSMILSTNEEGYTRAELLDPWTLELQGEVPLPGRGIAGLRWSRDGRFVACGFTSPVEPGDAWLHDTATGDTRRLTHSPRAVPAEEMVEPELVRFASFDGEAVPAFVYRPRRAADAPAGGCPVVVWVHGGPESQYVPAFNPLIQYFVARGYAVVAPNVRGSTGYGKRYHHLDDVERRLDSVADLGALHDWLGTQPDLDEARAALMGGSYGGYMTLAGLAFQPERWAAGVSVVGISSLVTFLENTSVWRRAFREREYGSLEHHRDLLEAASPITHVDRMQAPLFLIHGANDPRVPVGEAEQIHEVLTAKGVRCDLAVYPDEGHGLAKLKNRLDAYPRAADFLDEVLGTR